MRVPGAEARQLRQLKKLPLIESIDDERWDTLVPHIEFRDLDEGEILFEAGNKSQSLYLVVDGELGLYMPCPDESESYYLHSRTKGDTAGDFAALNGAKHLVNSVAIKKTRVAMLPIDAFELLIDINSDLLARVYDVAADLSRRVTLARAFLELFGDMTHATMNTLLDGTVVKHCMTGEVLFRENDPADGLYIVVSGRFLVETIDNNGMPQRMAEVRSPETVGELALLAGSKRHATVLAARESTVGKLDRTLFNTLIANRADMLMSLSRVVVRRHVAHARLSQKTARDETFVIVPLDKGLPVRRILHQLKIALRHYGEPMVLDSRAFDTLYGRRGAAQTPFNDVFGSAIAEWLDDKENRYGQLVYLADAQFSEWTRRCVNRADRVLLLADASMDNHAELREVELALSDAFTGSRVQPPIDLLLLHSADTVQPSHTERWLQPRRLDAYHHVRMDDTDHFNRLARRMCGYARGIVFSGGGARGYAHLGVQRVMEEEGIQVDYIGGSSMGGLLGASMAMGQKVADIELLSATFANKRALFDYTLPLASLMKSAKLTRFCREVYGDTRIEDLWTPYFCVSSNLADGREVIHDRGLLWKVVRSTISLPGIFTPVPTANGDLLIDGAVLNTFPVDVMFKRLGQVGDIIGVNVSQLREQFRYFDYDTQISGWRVLLSRINPFQPTIPIPRLAETLLRSTDIKSILRLNETRGMLDILIEPDVGEIPLLEFKSYKRISDIGYAEARKVFAEHKLCGPVEGKAITDAASTHPGISPIADTNDRTNSRTDGRRLEQTANSSLRSG